MIRILLAILIPPLGVFLQEGLKVRFWINVLLTLIGYIPGIVHAVYVIAKHDARKEKLDHRRAATLRSKRR